MTCIHFPGCGGCTLQHLSYADQLQQKQEQIKAYFAFAPESIRPIIACKDPWRYRNKMEFSFSQNKAGEKFLGLILKKSRGKVFHLHECLLCSSWFSETVAQVRLWWESTPLFAYNFRSGQGTLRSLTLREAQKTGQRLVMLTVSGNSTFAPHRDHLASFVKAIDDPDCSIFLRIQQCIPGTPTQFYEIHLSGPTHIEEELVVQGQTLRFKISPTSFFQPNTFQAEILYTQALELVHLTPQSHLFDLYCGTATLGMSMASHVKKVTAIELNPHAVFDAKANAELNHISNLEVICGDVGKVLEKYPKISCDLAIIDPPRAGLDPLALAQLALLNPSQILYISCNPETQAQNIAQLKGYTVKVVQPVDQFPHTAHIENLVVLSF